MAVTAKFKLTAKNAVNAFLKQIVILSNANPRLWVTDEASFVWVRAQIVPTKGDIDKFKLVADGFGAFIPTIDEATYKYVTTLGSTGVTECNVKIVQQNPQDLPEATVAAHYPVTETAYKNWFTTKSAGLGRGVASSLMEIEEE